MQTLKPDKWSQAFFASWISWIRYNIKRFFIKQYVRIQYAVNGDFKRRNFCSFFLIIELKKLVHFHQCSNSSASYRVRNHQNYYLPLRKLAYLIDNVCSSFCVWIDTDSDLSKSAKFAENVVYFFCSNFVR